MGLSRRCRKGKPDLPFNYPGSRLTRKKLRCFEPEKEAEEPYIVAILIALAQQRRREQRQQKSRAGENAAPHEILTPPSDGHMSTSPGEQDNSQCSESFKVRYHSAAELAWSNCEPRFASSVSPTRGHRTSISTQLAFPLGFSTSSTSLRSSHQAGPSQSHITPSPSQTQKNCLGGCAVLLVCR
jgi:hypothetical protein